MIQKFVFDLLLFHLLLHFVILPPAVAYSSKELQQLVPPIKEVHFPAVCDNGLGSSWFDLNLDTFYKYMLSLANQTIDPQNGFKYTSNPWPLSADQRRQNKQQLFDMLLAMTNGQRQTVAKHFCVAQGLLPAQGSVIDFPLENKAEYLVNYSQECVTELVDNRLAPQLDMSQPFRGLVRALFEDSTVFRAQNLQRALTTSPINAETVFDILLKQNEAELKLLVLVYKQLFLSSKRSSMKKLFGRGEAPGMGLVQMLGLENMLGKRVTFLAKDKNPYIESGYVEGKCGHRCAQVFGWLANRVANAGSWQRSWQAKKTFFESPLTFVDYMSKSKMVLEQLPMEDIFQSLTAKNYSLEGQIQRLLLNQISKEEGQAWQNKTKRSLVESVKADIRMQAGLSTRIWQQLGLFEATGKTIKKAILEAQLDDFVDRIRATMLVGFHSNGDNQELVRLLVSQSELDLAWVAHRLHILVGDGNMGHRARKMRNPLARLFPSAARHSFVYAISRLLYDTDDVRQKLARLPEVYMAALHRPNSGHQIVVVDDLCIMRKGWLANLVNAILYICKTKNKSIDEFTTANWQAMEAHFSRMDGQPKAGRQNGVNEGPPPPYPEPNDLIFINGNGSPSANGGGPGYMVVPLSLYPPQARDDAFAFTRMAFEQEYLKNANKKQEYAGGIPHQHQLLPQQPPTLPHGIAFSTNGSSTQHPHPSVDPRSHVGQQPNGSNKYPSFDAENSFESGSPESGHESTLINGSEHRHSSSSSSFAFDHPDKAYSNYSNNHGLVPPTPFPAFLFPQHPIATAHGPLPQPLPTPPLPQTPLQRFIDIYGLKRMEFTEFSNFYRNAAKADALPCKHFYETQFLNYNIQKEDFFNSPSNTDQCRSYIFAAIQKNFESECPKVLANDARYSKEPIFEVCKIFEAAKKKMAQGKSKGAEWERSMSAPFLPSATA